MENRVVTDAAGNRWQIMAVRRVGAGFYECDLEARQ
jgi:hypothetical protein